MASAVSIGKLWRIIFEHAIRRRKSIDVSFVGYFSKEFSSTKTTFEMIMVDLVKDAISAWKGTYEKNSGSIGLTAWEGWYLNALNVKKGSYLEKDLRNMLSIIKAVRITNDQHIRNVEYMNMFSPVHCVKTTKPMKRTSIGITFMKFTTAITCGVHIVPKRSAIGST